MVTTTTSLLSDKVLMKQAWDQHVVKAGSKEEVYTRYWQVLTTQLMQEPQRHYHNLFHMDLLSKHFRRLEVELKIPQFEEFCECFVLALWFHDAIYDPQSKSNEGQSAKLFRSFANETDLDDRLRWIVEQTILDTIKHK